MSAHTLDRPLDVLLIDNFDSFAFNLVDEFARRGADVSVYRNDIGLERAVDLAEASDLVVLSPGPGTPAGAGCSLDLVRRVAGAVPLLGICLGHQTIVEAFGGRVGRHDQIVHGKASAVAHEAEGLFAELPNPLKVGRYHSLVAHELPDELRVTARLGEVAMAVEHRAHRVAGVQFHPESILTPQGGRLVDNALRWAQAR